MPTIFIVFGLKFFFYSNEHLPMHVHIRNAEGEAKFEIKPVRMVNNKGLKPKDLKLAESIIEENQELLIRKWKEFHGESLV
ncbi:MAG: DUF4160 domain-containing protein [Cytophagaceae bacterium]|nr:DUF4160 domain-containing protein [Cytophagaceae bacterium]MBL0301526.1 DUF4160 domain-containing protein [Cytophagaceae bacterium]MBL0324348.1 DUF4160 domain-containing protein [Cytophagaceae bacterium]